MPAAGGRKPPPKKCPLCQAKIWDSDTSRSLSEDWRVYREHIHTTHPAYEGWDKKTSILYLIVAAIFVLGVFAVVFVPAGLSAIVFGSAVGVLFIGTTLVFLFKWSGKRRFRNSWNREHSSSANSV